MASCCICFSSLKTNDEIVAPQCGHVFHKDCLEKWITSTGNQPTCPSCRRSLNHRLFRRLHLDFNEDSIQNISLVEDLQKNVVNVNEQLRGLERKIDSTTRKYNTLVKSNGAYQERIEKLKNDIKNLKKTNTDLQKKLLTERKQRQFYENECLALTAQVDEMENNNW